MNVNFIKFPGLYSLKFFILTLTVLFFSAGEINFAQEKSEYDSSEKSGISKDDDELNAEQIIENNKAALISIWFSDNNFYSYSSDSYIDSTILNGSGFILSEDGLIGTNNHVIDNIDSIIIKTSDGNFFHAERVMTDEEKDFALIKIVNTSGIKFQTVRLGNSDDVKAGQEVFAIGSPLGFEYTISSGIVAAIRDNEKVNFSDPYSYVTNEKTFEKVIQITAAISPGNSGGALFNKKGEVIGITTYTYIGYGNLNFAVAINSYKKFMDLALATDISIAEDRENKREENKFNSNFRNAVNMKTQLASDWYYTKLKDSVGNADAYTERVDSLNKVRSGKIENLLEQCIQMKPDSFYVYQELLDLYVITDNSKKTEELYRKILSKFDSDSLLNQISSALASAYTNSGKYDQAIKFYNKMLEQDRTQYFINFQIAGIYEQKKDFQKAEQEYRKILKMDPNYNQAYTRLGKIYYENYGDLKKAKKYLQKGYDNEMEYTGSTPYDTDLLYYLGMIAVKEDKKMEAIIYYMDLKSNGGYNEDANKKKVKLLQAIRKLDE
ncbi:MAG: trypsin-like peptidase domain-containing protein [Bacteroidetes bacterium]|nr:trypsin-like peptidase domain-containing protein [Bacteroidota bacterium]